MIVETQRSESLLNQVFSTKYGTYTLFMNSSTDEVTFTAHVKNTGNSIRMEQLGLVEAIANCEELTVACCS